MPRFFWVKLLFFVTVLLSAICNAGSYRLSLYRTEVIIDLRFASGPDSIIIQEHLKGKNGPVSSSSNEYQQVTLASAHQNYLHRNLSRLFLRNGFQGAFSTSTSRRIAGGIIYLIVYTTDVQVGNPPQPFRAQVDLSWGDFFVPSVNCTYGCSDHNLYNSSDSSTYVPDLTPARVLHSGGNTWGNVSQDSLWVGGLEVRNQRFEEVTVWNAILYDELLDGALGLARLPLNYSDANVGARYPFQNIVAQGLLDRNLFSLALSPSRSEKNGGELHLGTIDQDSYIGDLTTIPVSSVSGTGADEAFTVLASSGWQLPINSVSVDGSKNPALGPFLAHFPNHTTAVFSTTFPYIIFPRNVVHASELFRRLGISDDDTTVTVNCDERPSLPNLTLSFGQLGVDAHHIVLTPWDYLYEVKNPDSPGKLCAVPFEDLEPEEDSPDHVFLGTAFMGGLYSVFDADEKTISFAKRKSMGESS